MDFVAKSRFVSLHEDFANHIRITSVTDVKKSPYPGCARAQLLAYLSSNLAKISETIFVRKCNYFGSNMYSKDAILQRVFNY